LALAVTGVMIINMETTLLEGNSYHK